MKFLTILGLLLWCITASANVVYKTVKEDGTVVYTDVPSKGATSVNFSTVNSAVIPTLGGATNKPTISTQSGHSESVIKYEVFIRSPETEQSLRDNSGNVSITAEVIPNKSGKFQLVLDNQVVSSKNDGLFKLENIERGAHNIEVHFLDNSGKILASSKQQTFYLHKTSALITPN